MDHQFYRPMPDRHSKHMENLSLIMGIIALSTFCLVYPALICGALGIVFALLSRGGETTREFDTLKCKKVPQSLEIGLFFCQIFIFII